MSRDALDVLTAWHELLGELGAFGRALCVAIEGDDVVGAMAAMHQLRRVRSAIARVEAPIQLHGEAAELEAMAQVSSLTVDARAAEGAMAHWLARELPGDPRLLASPLGVAVLADIILPPVWDFESDLVVLVGEALAPVADVLAAIGQRRIVVLGAHSVHAIPVESVDEACVAVRTMVPGPPAQLVVHGAAGSDVGQLDELVAKLRSTLSDLRIHRNTVRAFSRTWVEQGLANLAAVGRWPSIATVGDAFAGKPMVIVAPGPSLARNVEQLRALRGKAIITAFSHSLKPVLAAGVVPDLVVTVDPQDVRYHFAGCDVSRLCLVNAATVHPTLFELPARRFLTLSANCAIDDWIFAGLGEDASVPGGGSVATTAFSLALRWKCDPILFVGLDLSFPGGAYYVSTSSDGGARAQVANGVMRVEGWSSAFHAMKAAGGPSAAHERCVELPAWSGSGTVPSSFMFSLFHRWFVERMRAVPPDIAVYNCTEGGAFIEGMQHRMLADVLPLLTASTVDVAAVLDRISAGLAAAPPHTTTSPRRRTTSAPPGATSAPPRKTTSPRRRPTSAARPTRVPTPTADRVTSDLSHAGRQPAPTADRVTADPSHAGREAAPTADRVTSDLSHAGRQPAPTADRVTSDPSHAGRQPAPTSHRTSDPSHAGREAAPTSHHTADPSHAGRQPAPTSHHTSDPSHAGRETALTNHLTGFIAGLRRTRRLALAATSAIARGDTGNRLTKLERSLATALRPLGFISLLAQHDVERAHDTARRPAAASDYLAASSALFATLLAVTDQLEPALVDALARITARRTHGRAA